MIDRVWQWLAHDSRFARAYRQFAENFWETAIFLYEHFVNGVNTAIEAIVRGVAYPLTWYLALVGVDVGVCYLGSHYTPVYDFVWIIVYLLGVFGASFVMFWGYRRMYERYYKRLFTEYVNTFIEPKTKGGRP